LARDARESNLNRAYAYIARGNAYYGKDEFDRAIADYDEALRLKPDYADAFHNRGNAYNEKGEYDRAIADYDEALRLKPDDALASKHRDQVLATLATLATLTAAATPAPTPTAVAAPPTPQLPAAPAGRRVALVVANGAYREAALANPKVDADLVAASLTKIGFAVTEKKDLGLDAFEQAIGDFAEASRGADVALFYFAGHGFSIAAGGRQENVLMATDADFQAKTGLALERGGEPLDHVEETIIGHAKATLIFVDACRNVPALASRGVGARGFAPFDASAFDGAFVVVSTRQGKTAADGADGRGSPFARAFADVLPTPGLRIEDAAARIREKVRAETSGEQVPEVIRSDLPEGGVVLMTGAP
jgi:tetratricopeptide (TPR) repeat protein